MDRTQLSNEISGYWFKIKFNYDPITYVVSHQFLIKMANKESGIYNNITHLIYCDESDHNPDIMGDKKKRKAHENKIYDLMRKKTRINLPEQLTYFSCKYQIFGANY